MLKKKKQKKPKWSIREVKSGPWDKLFLHSIPIESRRIRTLYAIFYHPDVCDRILKLYKRDGLFYFCSPGSISRYRYKTLAMALRAIKMVIWKHGQKIYKAYLKVREVYWGKELREGKFMKVIEINGINSFKVDVQIQPAISIYDGFKTLARIIRKSTPQIFIGYPTKGDLGHYP